MPALRFHFALLLGFVLCGSAAAETLYKSTDRNGRVTYGDKPAPGAAKVDRLEVIRVAPEDDARAAAERERIEREAEVVRERERRREAARDRAQAEVVAALAALKAAQERREAGTEPLPGERRGNLRGGSRLDDAYFQRQRELDQAVRDAQLRLERAYARSNDLRE